MSHENAGTSDSIPKAILYFAIFIGRPTRQSVDEIEEEEETGSDTFTSGSSREKSLR